MVILWTGFSISVPVAGHEESGIGGGELERQGRGWEAAGRKRDQQHTQLAQPSHKEYRLAAKKKNSSEEMPK